MLVSGVYSLKNFSEPKHFVWVEWPKALLVSLTDKVTVRLAELFLVLREKEEAAMS